MDFRPLRDSRPITDRPLSVQLEAAFFAKLRHLSKKDQGRTMGAFREAILETNVKIVKGEPK